jgi:hypothetical protein
MNALNSCNPAVPNKEKRARILRHIKDIEISHTEPDRREMVSLLHERLEKIPIENGNKFQTRLITLSGLLKNFFTGNSPRQSINNKIL